MNTLSKGKPPLTIVQKALRKKMLAKLLFKNAYRLDNIMSQLRLCSYVYWLRRSDCPTFYLNCLANKIFILLFIKYLYYLNLIFVFTYYLSIMLTHWRSEQNPSFKYIIKFNTSFFFFFVKVLKIIQMIRKIISGQTTYGNIKNYCMFIACYMIFTYPT